jgi:ABC-type uncharacterized transport system permease subunit
MTAFSITLLTGNPWLGVLWRCWLPGCSARYTLLSWSHFRDQVVSGLALTFLGAASASCLGVD